jgi:hypothetical protein
LLAFWPSISPTKASEGTQFAMSCDHGNDSVGHQRLGVEHGALYSKILTPCAKSCARARRLRLGGATARPLLHSRGKSDLPVHHHDLPVVAKGLRRKTRPRVEESHIDASLYEVSPEPGVSGPGAEGIGQAPDYHTTTCGGDQSLGQVCPVASSLRT